MAKIFRCINTRTIIFNLKAENEDAAKDWLNSHSQEFVMNETTAYRIEDDDSQIFDDIDEVEASGAYEGFIDISVSY